MVRAAGAVRVVGALGARGVGRAVDMSWDPVKGRAAVGMVSPELPDACCRAARCLRGSQSLLFGAKVAHP
jgi:hypothetical protein